MDAIGKPQQHTHEIEAIAFDFGGVFIASPFESLAKLLADAQVPRELALPIIFGPYDRDTDHPWHRLERGELSLNRARDLIRERGLAEGFELDVVAMLEVVTRDIIVHQPMVECARRCRAAGLRTAMLTNNIAEAREVWRAVLPLEELFDVVVDSCEVGFRKPDERIFRHMLQRLGVPRPERVVFLDDVRGNITASQSLGMIGILVEDDATLAIAQVDRLLSSRLPPALRGQP
jgi:putative hydrolase of the HAD superfamily